MTDVCNMAFRVPQAFPFIERLFRSDLQHDKAEKTPRWNYHIIFKPDFFVASYLVASLVCDSEPLLVLTIDVIIMLINS